MPFGGFFLDEKCVGLFSETTRNDGPESRAVLNYYLRPERSRRNETQWSLLFLNEAGKTTNSFLIVYCDKFMHLDIVMPHDG